MQEDNDVVVIAFKRLRDGGYVALDSSEQPIKAFSSYNELEWSIVMDMRRVCGGHPADLPKIAGEQPHPARDEFPTQPAQPIPLRQRAINLVQRATR